MKVQITIKQVNQYYDQEYADEYHFGKESDTNRKYRWSRGFEVDNVDSTQELKRQTRSYPLKTDDKQFAATFENLRIFTCRIAGETTEMAVEESLVEKVISYSDPTRKTKRVYFYLKDNSEYYRLGEELYVHQKQLLKFEV